MIVCYNILGIQQRGIFGWVVSKHQVNDCTTRKGSDKALLVNPPAAPCVSGPSHPFHIRVAASIRCVDCLLPRCINLVGELEVSCGRRG